MKYQEKRFNTMKKLTVSRTCANKIPAMERSPISENRGHGITKNDTKLESPWKRQNSKLQAQATYTNTHLQEPFFNKLIEEGQIPKWLATGATILISENENAQRPKNCRPKEMNTTVY